jgi:hypothetical protein
MLQIAEIDFIWFMIYLGMITSVLTLGIVLYELIWGSNES